MQLNLAQAGIASLTREKQVLTVALKTRSEDISKMELKLEQTQQAYEDMLQGERFLTRDKYSTWGYNTAHIS